MKIKPCPFCGGEAQINERYRSGTANRKMYWVSCKACGISQQHDNTSGYRYQSKAIDRWNRREPMDKVVEQLEELATQSKELCERATRDGSGIMARIWAVQQAAFEQAIEIVKKGGASDEENKG